MRAPPRLPALGPELPPASQRLESLDVFRGLTIAAMLLVNNPGNDHAYGPLEHAENAEAAAIFLPGGAPPRANVSNWPVISLAR